MNLSYQAIEEAADEVREAMKEEEGWLTVRDVADLMEVDYEEEPEALQPVIDVLNFLALRGRVYRVRSFGGGTLYRA
jgi:Fe2+ or Zn2+ uptake regulation protein